MSKFNLTHDKKLSFKLGRLVPSLCLEAYPGDSFNLSSENMFRFAPLVAPVMHDIDIDTHYFFVPNRILWKNWENFITNNTSGEHPYITSINGFVNGSLGDYMGLPDAVGATVAEDEKVNALPFAAYLRIYDEWFRDQNFGEGQSITADGETRIVDGDNNSWLTAKVSANPLPRAWGKDYFTSALPFPQNGPDVKIPIFEDFDAAVEHDANGNPVFVYRQDTNAKTEVGTFRGDSTAGANYGALESGDNINLSFDPNGTLIVPGDSAGTIRMLRNAIKLQEWYEKQARGGTRYTESVLAHFGTKTGDARLNRPELIGSMRQKMVISEVLSTAETADAPIGQMAGHGISAINGKNFNYTCREHGWVIGIVSVRPRAAYQQGLHRSFSRLSMLDYMWPSFANIGEQAVLNKEVYINQATTDDLDETFGYAPRYAELRYHPSTVHGAFRSSLNFWHMGRIFATPPLLNQEFVDVPDPGGEQTLTRIFADTSGDHLWSHIINKVSVRRALPKYTIPSI